MLQRMGLLCERQFAQFDCDRQGPAQPEGELGGTCLAWLMVNLTDGHPKAILTANDTGIVTSTGSRHPSKRGVWTARLTVPSRTRGALLPYACLRTRSRRSGGRHIFASVALRCQSQGSRAWVF